MIAINDTKAIILSPDQAVRLMAICVMLKDGDLTIICDSDEDAEKAHDVICDIGEEMAIQLHGYNPLEDNR